jgi:AAA domain
VPTPESRPLHLHTIDSLVADLVSGRPVETGASEQFVLTDKNTRSALEWYREKGPSGWDASVSAAHGEALVDAVLLEPPELPALPAPPANANSRRLRLKKLEAHRFAGLHKFGTPDAAPENYIHEFTSTLTLFEGRNGSGKTSLLNAIIWALTGEMLRPQREPEPAEDFECRVAPASAVGQPTVHKLSSLTPMPDVQQYRPDQAWVPTDTWVELTFIDEASTELPVIRRSQSRSPQGKLTETPADLSVLRLDPIAARIGTVMPGLLPLIKVGHESELGRAVAQLTGLSGLVDLADHVRRAKAKIEKEFVKAKMIERDRADHDYRTARDDLEKILLARPNLKLAISIPQPSDDAGIEQALLEITNHFESAKANAFESARDILGDRFDPADPALIADLAKNVDRALERASKPQELRSAARLSALKLLTTEQLNAAETKIQVILNEADTLSALARNPATAARTRLYARVADWIRDHPDSQRSEDLCLVCGGNLDNALDPVTGKLVKAHIHDASMGAALLSQTLGRWAENVRGDLIGSLADALRTEAILPDHPCDLLRAAIVDELFAFDPFRGVLGTLKLKTASAFDEVAKDRAALREPIDVSLPQGCEELGETIKQIDFAIRFARWRQDNDNLAREISAGVLGRMPKEGEPSEKVTLIGQLLDLEATVKAAQPVSEALVQCGRLKQHLKSRRAAETRIREYKIACAALANLASLGELADKQVDQLRKILRKDAAAWRDRIYLGAFPDTAQELVDTGMGRKGELDLIVQTGGVSAPAQHVTNASALRASLVAFFLAFWQHVLKERGGLMTLVLDDPQELLDDENREKLAAALFHLVDASAQLVVTSYDPRFCARVSRLAIPSGVGHFEVHPATRLQPRVRTTSPRPMIAKRKAQFDADRNAEEPAREFADDCRVFIEAKLGDMFDDPAHAAWTIDNPNPTLATFIHRLRPLVKSGPQGMFSASVFRKFVDHPALVDNSLVIELMNKAHHGRRQEIRAADVAQCADQLSDLLEIVEEMYEECYRWRRRDAPSSQPSRVTVPALSPMTRPELNVLVCPDLAAFTQQGPTGESQDSPECLDPGLFDSAVAYYLRRPNFGFAAPLGSIAIVEAIPGPAADRRLVIARHGNAVYARRILRSANSGMIGLTADIPDPRKRTPKTVFLPETEFAIHQVFGIIFDHTIEVAHGQDEAELVDVSEVLNRIKIAFRVVGESAVPLALDKQVVLGGSPIELQELGRHEDALVALTLDDGSSIFKRVGAALPGELSYLRQFESIGGLGSSQVLCVGKTHQNIRSVTNARAIVGVLYHG